MCAHDRHTILAYDLSINVNIKFIIAMSTDVQDVIITAENPVYVVMTKHKAKVELCENSAYGVLS